MAVRRVKGVQKVEGNAKERTVTVQFDPQATTVEEIKQSMARIGYEAQEL